MRLSSISLGVRHFPVKRVLRYLLVIAFGNLVWEFAHMPLYELWQTGTRAEIVFAAVHCTGGDILIAFFALTLSLLVMGNNGESSTWARPTVVLAIVLGLLYTAFSEWLNIEIRGSWAYSDWMPVIPVINMGLSPALQWIVIPMLAFKISNGR